MALVNRTLALVVLWGIALLAQQQRVPAAGREQMDGYGRGDPVNRDVLTWISPDMRLMQKCA